MKILTEYWILKFYLEKYQKVNVGNIKKSILHLLFPLMPLIMYQ